MEIRCHVFRQKDINPFSFFPEVCCNISIQHNRMFIFILKTICQMGLFQRKITCFGVIMGTNRDFFHFCVWNLLFGAEGSLNGGLCSVLT